MLKISEVARLLEVDRSLVKRWTKEFKDHLSSTANPSRDVERNYTLTDLCALAFVATNWDPSATSNEAAKVESDDSGDDEEPSPLQVEYDHLRGQLSSDAHFQSQYLEFARLHSPLFPTVPDEVDETWRHGSLLGGMADRRLPQVARAYKRAGDHLVDEILAGEFSDELDYPILFLYRHTIEVFMKSILASPPEHHDLNRLAGLTESEFSGKLPEWAKARLRDFHKIDQMSDTFRYNVSIPSGELWVDFPQLRYVMDCLAEIFENTLISLGKCS